MKNQDSYDHLYKPAEKWVILNKDEDLTPIYISMPSPPPLELIDGYGLHPDEQVFKRKEIPQKLKSLEKRAFALMYDVEKANKQETVQGYKVYQKFWELLEEESQHYEDEIQWIKNVWWWRTYGYWCFIDGQPTYLPADYFDFLSFWYLQEAETYPDYRDDDRIKYLFAQYLESATETFVDIDNETGRAVKVDGKYRMVDVGSRVFFGDMEPKFRRCGATHQGCHKVWKGNSTTLSSYGTIVSMEGSNAEKHYYKKLLPAWNKYPLFLKPIWVGSKRPTSIKMAEPPNVFHIEGLGSMIDFTDSAGVSKNDGDRLNYSLFDEEGKTPRQVVFERWNVNKIAMSTGGGTNIIGYCKHPSTVEEMEEGGIEYYKMGQLSCFYERMAITGQTFTGLARIFFPAFRKLEGYIDFFGKSVIDTPTERQIRMRPKAKFAITGKGAKETLQSELDALLAKGTPEALELYRSRRRKFPMRWADCWIGSAGNVGFDMLKIDQRLGELNRLKSLGKTPYKIGRFDWENGIKFGRVIWRTDPDNGNFRFSYDLQREQTNLRVQSQGWDASKGAFVPMWKPAGKVRITLGVDPFSYMNKSEAKFSSTSSRQSDGGIAGLLDYDPMAETSKDIKEWNTKTFILSYRNRPPSLDEFCEDVLKAAIYLNAHIFPENNVNEFWAYFIRNGFGQYLLYDTDIRTGKLKEKPGHFTSTETKVAYFQEVKDYVEFRIHKENHDDIIQEIKDIKGLEDMTHRDLFTATAMALMGSKTRTRQIRDVMFNTTVNFSGIGMFKKRQI